MPGPLFSPAAIERYADPARLTQDAPAPAPTMKKGGIGPWPYVASALGDGLDALTTVQAIRSGRGREANPILGRGLPMQMAVKAAGSVGILWALRRIARDHPTLAKIIGYGNGIGKGALAVRNTQVGR